MIKMTATPKPSTLKNSGVVGPKLTEEDFLEINEKISEAMEFNNEVKIIVFHQKPKSTILSFALVLSPNITLLPIQFDAKEKELLGLWLPYPIRPCRTKHFIKHNLGI